MANLIELQPDIDALLNAETYQSMSDAEIDALIDYKVECAMKSATLSEDARSYESIMASLMERQAEAQRNADKAMQAALDAQFSYKEV